MAHGVRNADGRAGSVRPLGGRNAGITVCRNTARYDQRFRFARARQTPRQVVMSPEVARVSSRGHIRTANSPEGPSVSRRGRTRAANSPEVARVSSQGRKPLLPIAKSRQAPEGRQNRARGAAAGARTIRTEHRGDNSSNPSSREAPLSILGIDPGLDRTGYAVIRMPAARVLDAGVIRSDTNLPLARRLAEITLGVEEVLSEHRVSVVAVEDLFAHYAHPRTAILMGHARGVVLLAAARAGIDVVGILPTRVKKTLTGNGHASKLQMQRAIMATLNLPRPPEPPDVADALAIAWCAAMLRALPGASISTTFHGPTSLSPRLCRRVRSETRVRSRTPTARRRSFASSIAEALA